MDTDELTEISRGDDGESCDVKQARDIARNQLLRLDRTGTKSPQCHAQPVTPATDSQALDSRWSMENLQNELPQEIFDQLDPKLAELFSQMPFASSSRIASLVGRALQLPIHPTQLVKYAFLFAEAERQAKGDAVSEDHATRSRHELAGESHALQTGYSDTTKARQRYRCGRRARQQIAALLQGLLTNWERVEHVVLKHREELPVYLRPTFSNEELAGIHGRLAALGRAVRLGRDVLIEKSHRRKLTVAAQTYIWWRFTLAPYTGKWNDMHRLAVAWRLSDVRDVESFRRIVGRICRGLKSMHCTFGSAWQIGAFRETGTPAHLTPYPRHLEQCRSRNLLWPP
ncbi:MAG TPA: hypothetical protein VEU11_04675 [Terriglobales bacterium]|nr:hypothetical protein [Terriglobales bacterium]